MPLIVDAHQDLAWNAITFKRDYSQSALAIRESEKGTDAPIKNGLCTIGLPELLQGEVAIVFGTLFASPMRRKMGEWDGIAYADSDQAHKLYSQQLDYYNRLTDEHPQFTLIHNKRDLEEVLTTWSNPPEGSKPSGEFNAKRKVGIVRLIEGADCIREPQEAEWWMEHGVRIIGLAWTGTKYSGGTGEPAPLTPEGRRLLRVMSDLGLILDLSHSSDQSFFESLDHFEGTVITSHANPRALWLDEVKAPERALSDDMIRQLAERDGVMGIVPYNRFLKATWKVSDGKTLSVNHIAAMIDHVCQITGSADHVGMGSDLDGGFGAESIPAEMDTVADLKKVEEALKAKGYNGGDTEKIMSGNWLRILRKGLPA
ncbi:MAG: membrane dipeptidase [Chloroflexi bacterium]|nr:membrane dipeptidase [Chloroflexota bacterium]